MASPIDRAGRAVAGLIGYNPGPGIYSRLERAVQGMPANVRVEEIPGLLKRYKDGVPGWELKAADLDSVIAGRDVVPREELLSAVRERSPVYTHGEVVLGGRPQIKHVPTGGTAYRYDAATDTSVRLPDPTRPEPDYQFPDTGEVSRLGMGVSHGEPKYREYGQGGDDYAELLLTQPGHKLPDYGSHWADDTKNAVAHARFDTHGDALRINELQSDLGIHNRKMREAGPPSEYAGGDGPFDFMPPQSEEEMAAMRARSQVLPFPMEDAWSDLLIKRLALEAARQGHRAIEVASPRAIADKVGGNIDNYEHFYGKVVPGAIERLGRKMGGLVDDTPAPPQWLAKPSFATEHPLTTQLLNEREGYELATGLNTVAADNRYKSLVRAFASDEPQSQRDFATLLHGALIESEGLSAAEAAREMPRLMSLAARHGEAHRGWGVAAYNNSPKAPASSPPPGRRYIMSDEMRKRILTQGIGASLLAPMAMEE